MNELAWILATDQDARVRNGPEALDLAFRACALTTNREPSYLGTLDAAYAESGRFNEAIATAQKALGLFLASGDTNLARMAEQRLQLYRAARPYRQGSIQR
jgi:tetratricopeptide (TPR) repeat protein